MLDASGEVNSVTLYLFNVSYWFVMHPYFSLFIF